MKNKFQTLTSQLNMPFKKLKRKKKRFQCKFQCNNTINLRLQLLRILVQKWHKLDQSSKLIKFLLLHLYNENKIKVNLPELLKTLDLLNKDRHYKQLSLNSASQVNIQFKIVVLTKQHQQCQLTQVRKRKQLKLRAKVQLRDE